MKKLKFILFASLVFLIVACGKQTEETTPIIKSVTETVFASGFLEADGFYKLTAQSNGYLTTLNFEEGDIVRKGEILADIDNKESLVNLKGAEKLLQIAKSNSASSAPLLKQAKSNITIAKERMSQDKIIAERYTRLWEKNSIAKIDYENALLNYETAKNNLAIAEDNYQKIQDDANQQVVSNRTNSDLLQTIQNNTRIQALISGKVYKKHKELGDYVRQGDVIAEIGSADLLYALVNIDESSIYKIKVGQEAVIQLNTNTENSYQGVVKEILPAFDDATQSFLCKLYFRDSLNFKIINTQLQCNITVGSQESVIMIPRNYIDFGGYVQEKGKEKKTKVETKFVSTEWVQVLSGIDENTVLVTDNIAINQ